MLRPNRLRRRLSDDPDDTPRRRRSRWRMVLLVGGGVLALYYGFVFVGMRDRSSGEIALDGTGHGRPSDRVTLQVDAVELDPSTGALDLRFRPVPRGSFADGGTGELRTPLQVQVLSTGQPPASFDFGASQLIDAVGTSVEVTSGANSFPFDRPRADVGFLATSGGQRVPLELEMADRTEGWEMSGAVRPRGAQLAVELDARRETLAVSFAIFYIAGIVVVALITIAVIGGAIARGSVGFDQVIWLGAMLVAIPAVRNEMPGVPPIGTAVDLFVFLPSVVIVGLALLAAIIVVAINEASEATIPDVEES